MNLNFLESGTSEESRAALQAAVRIIKQVGIFKRSNEQIVDVSNIDAINQSQDNTLSRIIAEVEVHYGKSIATMHEAEAIKALNYLVDLESQLGPQKSDEGQKLADEFLARLSER